jgi:hypothetical protein
MKVNNKMLIFLDLRELFNSAAPFNPWAMKSFFVGVHNAAN